MSVSDAVRSLYREPISRLGIVASSALLFAQQRQPGEGVGMIKVCTVSGIRN